MSEINVSARGRRAVVRRCDFGGFDGLREGATGEQELALQHDALTGAGYLRIFSDTAKRVA